MMQVNSDPAMGCCGVYYVRSFGSGTREDFVTEKEYKDSVKSLVTSLKAAVRQAKGNGRAVVIGTTNPHQTLAHEALEQAGFSRDPGYLRPPGTGENTIQLWTCPTVGQVKE